MEDLRNQELGNSNCLSTSTWQWPTLPPPPPEHQSSSISQLATALAQAQSEMEAATKTSSNPFFRSRYADLNSIWESIIGPLTKNGLSIAQITVFVDKQLFLKTILMHKSGEWISGVYPIISAKQDPQSIGSAISYARRYALAIVGARSVDDDGEAAMDRRKTEAVRNEPAKPTYVFEPSTPSKDSK